MLQRLLRVLAMLFGVFILVSCGGSETGPAQDAIDAAVDDEIPDSIPFADDEDTDSEVDEQVETSTTVELLDEQEGTVQVAEVCAFEDDESLSFETLPGVSCQEVIAEAQNVLIPFGYDATSQGFFTEIVTICQDLDIEITHLPESPQVPALADAIVGTLCPGDRALIVEAS